MHNIYKMSIHTWLHQSPESCYGRISSKSVFAYHCVKAASSNKRTTCNHHFHQKCHPQCVWSRDVTNQSFQVAGPNNRTTCILPFSFYHVPSGRSEQPGQLASPFYQSIIRNGKTEQPNSLRLPFYLLFYFKPPVLRDCLNLSVILFQAASPKGPFEFIFYLISSRQS